MAVTDQNPWDVQEEPASSDWGWSDSEQPPKGLGAEWQAATAGQPSWESQPEQQDVPPRSEPQPPNWDAQPDWQAQPADPPNWDPAPQHSTQPDWGGQPATGVWSVEDVEVDEPESHAGSLFDRFGHTGDDRRKPPKEPGAGKPVKFMAVGVVALLVVFLLGWAGLSMFTGGGSEAAPPPSSSAVTSSHATRSSQDNIKPQLRKFVHQLGKAMTNRDGQAYYDLLTPESQQRVTLDRAKKSMKGLPAGTTYDAKLDDFTVAGPTAALTITVTAKRGDQSKASKMHADVERQSDGSWKMVVKDSSQ